jgi:pyridoxal phosphate enzyme (YggS family)
MYSIKANAEVVREKIIGACKAAHRDVNEVTLIAVTKNFPAEAVLAAAAEGIADIGENRVQELTAKKELVSVPVRWHMIGHLQTNKVKYIAPFIHCIHSVDSAELLGTIDKEAKKAGRVIDILVEVNVSGEPQKYGMSPDNASALAHTIGLLTNVRATGLMTVAQDTDDNSVLHEQFETLRLLRDAMQRDNIPNVPMTELSMGMSHDFEIAIAEGATMIRLGTALFGERNYAPIPA